MALEIVSPPEKYSQPAFLPSFSLDGSRLLLKIEAALAGTPGYQDFGGDTYVANRGVSGWKTTPTAPPDRTIVAGGSRNGNPATFTPSLDRWAQLGATQSQFQVGIARLFGGGVDGSFEPLSPLLMPIDDSGGAISKAVLELEVSGSTPDLGTTVLRVAPPSTSYFPEDPRSSSAIFEPGFDRNSYVAYSNGVGEPDIELLARDKNDVVYGGRCGAHLGGDGATFNQGAISSDGSRIFFSTRPAQEWDEEELEGPGCDTDNGLRILERITTPEGPVIVELAPGGGGPTAPGDDLFQAASADGSKVYFLSPRKLTPSDADAAPGPCSGDLGASKGCDLFLYDANLPEGERIVHASAGEGPGEADVLLSTTAISGDGSRAYFVAQGVLSADSNPEGATAQAGQPNLYLFDAGTSTLSFLATLDPADSAGLWNTKGSRFGDAYAVPFYGPDLQGGGDGHVLAFASKASLITDDEDGGFRDVFRYNAVADSLQRLSKASGGGEDNGPFDVSVNPAVAKIVEYNFGEATRWASEDGELIAFATAESLIPSDTDELTNPYVWEGGELGASFAEVVEPPAVAPMGDQIAFATQTELLPPDLEAAQDVYVARANGGFTEPSPPPVCDPLSEGACEGPPSPKPTQVPPSPAGLSGNVDSPTKCKKGFVRRKGKCVKKSGQHKGVKRRGQKRGKNR